MRIFLKYCSLILAVVIAAIGFIPVAADSEDATLCINGIIKHNLEKFSASSIQEWIDGELTESAGIGSEWYIIALSNYGKYDFSGYNTALNEYLAESDVGSASSRLKYALAMVAIGDETNPYIDEILGNSIGEQGIMSLIFGLHLLNNGCECNSYSKSKIIGELLSLQLADGGWSVMGEHGDVDVTAMTVQAFSPYYAENSDVESSVNDALEFLSERQLEDGGYSAYGESNPESISQVVIALSSLGIDFATDSRFIKNGNTLFDGTERFHLTDGSYCHKEGGESNSTATVQVLSAAIAYKNMKNGKSPFYIFSKNEPVCETTTKSSTATMKSSDCIDKNKETAHQSTMITVSSVEETKAEETQTEKNKFNTLIVTAIIIVILICIALLMKSRKKSKVVFALILICMTIISLAMSCGFLSRDTDSEVTVTISIRCDTVKDISEKHIPADGVILDETEVNIKNGDTVYDVLSKVCQKNKIHLSSNMAYIEGINNIYEMDFGDSSGWIYFVNGESPSVGCKNYKLSEGDEIEWHYTRDFGKDLTAS